MANHVEALRCNVLQRLTPLSNKDQYHSYYWSEVVSGSDAWRVGMATTTRRSSSSEPLRKPNPSPLNLVSPLFIRVTQERSTMRTIKIHVEFLGI